MKYRTLRAAVTEVGRGTCWLAFVLSAVFALNAPARASTYQISFSASNFGPQTPDPFSPLTGDIVFTANSNYPSSANGITGISSFDITTGGTTYVLTNIGVGISSSTEALFNGSATINSVAYDFHFNLESPFGGTTDSIAFESQSCTTCLNPASTFSDSVTATPLPAALPLFATGLGGLGLLGWRRKRKAQAA